MLWDMVVRISFDLCTKSFSVFANKRRRLLNHQIYAVPLCLDSGIWIEWSNLERKYVGDGSRIIVIGNVTLVNRQGGFPFRGGLHMAMKNVRE